VSCGQTVRRIDIRFQAKDAPFIRTSEAKKTRSENSTVCPPILGVKWGGGMENVEKKRTNVRLSRPLRKILMFCLHLCVAPT
jgi:hypothetical protein